MSKPVITRLFVGSVIAVIAAFVLGFVAVVSAYANGAFQMDGPDVVGLNGSAFTWSMIGLIVTAGLTVIASAIGGLIAWIGALLNTARLEDKTWFVLLLVLGVFSFGFVAMVAYVIAGPDGTLEPMVSHDRAMHAGGATPA